MSAKNIAALGEKLWLIVCGIVCFPLVPLLFGAIANADTFAELIGALAMAVMFWVALVFWAGLHFMPLFMLGMAILVTHRMLTAPDPGWDGMRVWIPIMAWLLAAGITAGCWWSVTTACERMLSKGPMCVVVDAIASGEVQR